MKTIAAILIASAPLLAQTDLEDDEAPARPWSASLGLVRPLGEDNPWEVDASLARRFTGDLGSGTLSATPSVSGAVGQTDLDTTWSLTPALSLAWEQGLWTVSVHGNAQVRSWDSTDVAGSGSLTRTLSEELSWSLAGGGSLLSGSWARTTLDWSRQGATWGGGASIGAGYLWDVEIASAMGKGSNRLKTMTADQMQALPSLFLSWRGGNWNGSGHLDADLRGYERTRGGMGKGKSASSATTLAWSATLDPWAQAGWSRNGFGIDLSGGWSQGIGAGASTSGLWAGLETSLRW